MPGYGKESQSRRLYPTSAGLSRRIQQALHTAKSAPGTTTFSQMCGRCESQPWAQAWRKDDLLSLHPVSVLSRIASGSCNSGFFLSFSQGESLMVWGGLTSSLGCLGRGHVGSSPYCRDVLCPVPAMHPPPHTRTHGNVGPAQMPCAATTVPLCPWLPGPSLRYLPGFRLWCLMVSKGCVP